MKLTRLMFLLLAFFSLGGLATADVIVDVPLTETFTFGQQSSGWRIGWYPDPDSTSTYTINSIAEITWNIVDPNNTARRLEYFYDASGQVLDPITGEPVVNQMTSDPPASDLSGFNPITQSVNSAWLSMSFFYETPDPLTQIQIGGGEGISPVAFWDWSVSSQTNTFLVDLGAFADPMSGSLESVIANLQDGVYVSTADTFGDLYLTSASLTITAGNVPATVPEPSSILLLSSGLLGIGLVAKRRLLG